MRKFTKMMLALAMLFGAVGGASSVKADNATLDQLEAAYGTTSDWRNSIPNLPVQIKDGTIFGSDASSQTTNANVNNYDYLYVTVTDFSANKAVRIFFWDKYQNTRIDYYLKPVADKETADYSVQSDITANGTYCVKIPDGARLQGAKPALGSSADVSFKFSEIYLTERATPYVELEPYTLVYSNGKAVIPISESHVRTTGNVSINYTTGEVTNTGTGKLIIYLNNEDLIGATLYHADVTDENATPLEPILEVADAVNGEVGGIYGSRYNWNIAGDAGRRDRIGSVTALRYNFSKKGTMTFNSIYILANELVAGTEEKNLTSMPYGIWGLPANKISNYVEADAFYTNNIDGESRDALMYGHDGNGDAHKYVDLTNCSKIIFTGSSSNGAIRLFYNWSGTDADKPIETISDFPKTEGTYEFDIDAFKKSKGITFFHLIGIKSQWAPVALSEVKVVEYTNVISGSGIDRTKNYLKNPYLTSIDATGVTDAREISVLNPNCLITASAGKVTNEKNVIVDGVCANLELTDGEPFKAPSAFTATNAKFTRKFSSADYATMVVPFDVATLPTQPATVKAYKLKGVNGEAITTDVLTSLTANEPVMVKVTADDVNSYEFTASDVSVAATSGDLVENGLLKATYATTTAAAGASNYVLQKNGEDVNFYLVTGTSATVKPFRAYLHYENPGAHILSILFDDATGIEKVEKEASVKENGEFFNLAGQRVAQPTKGLYIVNGKKVVIK